MDVIKLVFSGSDVLDWFALGTHSLNLQTWEHSFVSINMSSGIVKVNSRVGPDIRLISNTWYPAMGTNSLNLQTWEHSCISINMSSGIVKVDTQLLYSTMKFQASDENVVRYGQ